MNKVLRGSGVLAFALIASLVGCANSGQKTGAYVDDAWITSKVKSELLAKKDVSGTQISVNTTKGVVTLSGNVKTAAESEKAESVAQSVKGVTFVQNEIRVE